jgi:hypothetical protein
LLDQLQGILDAAFIELVQRDDDVEFARIFSCTLESSGSVTIDRIMLRRKSSRPAGSPFFLERAGEVGVADGGSGGELAVVAFLPGRFGGAIVSLFQLSALRGGCGSRWSLGMLWKESQIPAHVCVNSG